MLAISLAVDAMGGDTGLDVTIPASISFLKSHPSCAIILVGQTQSIKQTLERHGASAAALMDQGRLSIEQASEVVLMDDPLTVALRSKKDSSMRIGAQLVKDGKANALISAGNTGALMAVCRFVLKTHDGIDRPAIAAQLPCATGKPVTVLDLGANVDCSAEHLVQFAIMGVALASALDEANTLANPTVGLLNVGEEVIKGNDIVKAAASALAVSGLNFVGNVEGNDIYKGKADVVVCDGFVGNVALKASEGLAQMIGQFLREEYSRTWVGKLAAVMATGVLSRFKHRLDHRRYNGASLVGLRGVVIKSHGSADSFAFEHALRRAYDAVNNQLLEKITVALANAQIAPPALEGSH
jgi:phosphate acyltransferase